MNQLLESLRQNSSLRYKKILRFIPLQMSGVLPDVERFLFRGMNWVNYYGGFGTTIAAVVALVTVFYVAIQTTELKKQVKITGEQLRLTEESLEFVNRQIQNSLAVTRPFVYILPARKNNFTEWGYSTVNPGNIPARVVAKHIQIQAGNQSWKTNPEIPVSYFVSKEDEEMYAGLQKIAEDTANKIRSGKIILKMAACIVYKSVDDNDPRKWIAISKDVYDSRIGKFSLKFRDIQNASSDTQKCSVELP